MDGREAVLKAVLNEILTEIKFVKKNDVSKKSLCDVWKYYLPIWSECRNMFLGTSLEFNELEIKFDDIFL